MRVLINAATTFKGGSVQVAESFINECKNYKQHEFHVILSKRLQERIEENEFPENFHFYPAPFRPASKVFSLSDPAAFHKKIEESCKPDVVFTTSGPAYWNPKVPHLIGYNLAHYIYPESALFKMMPLGKRLKWKLKGKVIYYYFKRDADAYVVQTDDVNQRLSKWINNSKNIYTVTNTCSQHYFKPEKALAQLPDKSEQEFRLLTLSAYYLHKNLEIIKPLIAILKKEGKSNIKFVTTLPQKTFEQIFNAVERESIYNVGPVPMNKCPSLYQECDAMFLPTLLECFSASYPEAMAMKKPILTSDLGFARTICGEAAIYFDPLNAKDIAEKIIVLYENQELQQTLIEKGTQRLSVFDTPKTRAQKYLEICQSLIMN